MGVLAKYDLETGELAKNPNGPKGMYYILYEPGDPYFGVSFRSISIVNDITGQATHAVIGGSIEEFGLVDNGLLIKFDLATGLPDLSFGNTGQGFSKSPSIVGTPAYPPLRWL